MMVNRNAWGVVALLAAVVLMGSGALLVGSRPVLAARGITVDPLHRGAWGFGTHQMTAFHPNGSRQFTVRRWRLGVFVISHFTR
jgi:hypothetical protein